MIIIPVPVILRVSDRHPLLRSISETIEVNRYDVPSYNIEYDDIDRDILNILLESAEELNIKYLIKSLKYALRTLDGEELAIPHPCVSLFMIMHYILKNSHHGWVYHKKGSDDTAYYQPYAIDGIGRSFSSGDDMSINFVSFSIKEGAHVHSKVQLLRSRGFPKNILQENDLYVGNDELIQKYYDTLDLLFNDQNGLMRQGYGQQIIVNGIEYEEDIRTEYRSSEKYSANVKNRKAVLESIVTDKIAKNPSIYKESYENSLYKNPQKIENVVDIPALLDVRVFDLTAEEFLICSAFNIQRYIYDDSIKDKLILPSAHKMLIDVLTSQDSQGISDIIYGKGQGTLILCKGEPGIGKTLTAQVVSEVLHKPLYTMDSSSIISSWDIRKKLAKSYDLVYKWNGILLFDEVDTLISRRGTDLEKNRVTAELLRSLEEFKGIAFLTTNRPQDIDDAFLSRCIAIIDYGVPVGDDAIKAWKSIGLQVMGEEIIDDALAEALDRDYHDMPPRDMRQLLRLSFQLATYQGERVTKEIIDSCAVFRGYAPHPTL